MKEEITIDAMDQASKVKGAYGEAHQTLDK